MQSKSQQGQRSRIEKRLGLGALAVLMLLAISDTAAAQCQDFPKIPWMRALTHEAVAEFIDKKRFGQWEVYIDEIVASRTRMVEIAAEGGTWKSPRKGVELRGRDLVAHILRMERMAEVLRCLAKEEADFKALAGFETASGEGPATEPLNLEIDATLDRGKMSLRLVNKGETWPAMRTVSVVSKDDSSLIVQRRLRLAENQAITFRIDPERHGNEVRIRVN